MEHTGDIRQTLTRFVLSLPRTLPACMYALTDYHLRMACWYLMAAEINEGTACGLMPAMMAWSVPLEHASQKSLTNSDSPCSASELPSWCPDAELFSAMLRTRGSPTRAEESLRAGTYDEYVAWRLKDGLWFATMACVDVEAAREWSDEAATGRLDASSGDSVSIFDAYSYSRGRREDRAIDATSFDRGSSLLTDDTAVHPYRAQLCQTALASTVDYLGCGISGWRPRSNVNAVSPKHNWYASVWSNALLGPTLADHGFLEWCAAVKAAGGSRDDHCPSGAACTHPARYHAYALAETLRYVKTWWASPGSVTSAMITDFGEGVDACRSRWQAGEGRHDPGCSFANVAPWPTSFPTDIVTLRCVTHHAMVWASLRASLDSMQTAVGGARVACGKGEHGQSFG